MRAKLSHANVQPDPNPIDLESDRPPSGRLLGVCIILAIIAILVITSKINFLLFHALVEIFSIVVAFSMFVVAWNSRRFVKNDYLFFLGTAYFFVAAFDLIHTLTYKGMGVFSNDYGSDLPTQLWIASRYLESASLLAALFFLKRRLNAGLIFTGFSLLSILLAAAIYYRIFPACFVEPTGLTTFKKNSEYIICLILLLSLAIIYRKRKSFEPGLSKFLVASIILTIVSELFFTMYLSVFGFANAAGHYLKATSFYMIYLAITKTGIVAPYQKLTREVRHRSYLQESLLLVSDREQRNIATELHDTAGQQLAGTLYMLDALRSDIAETLPPPSPGRGKNRHQHPQRHGSDAQNHPRPQPR